MEGSDQQSLGRRVLIADDDAMQRHLFERLCQSQGVTCDTATNGAEALHLSSSQPYGIIFVDLYMPGTKLESLVPGLQRQQPNASIIVVSVEDDEHTLKDIFDLGITAFLRKPVEPAVLNKALERCLGKRTENEACAFSEPERS